MSKGDMQDVITTQVNGELEMEGMLKEAQKPAMTSYLACAIAEGFCEGEGASEEEQIEAWQYLIDTGLCWKLQGWYGRSAMQLIEEGICSAPKQSHRDAYGNVVPGTEEG